MSSHRWSAKNDEVAKGNGHPNWAAWHEAVERELGHAVCGARTRQQRPCREGPGNNANGRCWLHGGRAVVGVAHGRFTHGRATKTMPVDIAAAMEQARTDPELLSLRDQIAVVQAKEDRILAAMAALEDGPDDELWGELQDWAEHKRRLVETEVKLRVAHHDMISKDRLGVVLVRVGDAMRAALSEVSDERERRRALASFASELRRFYAPERSGA